MRRLSRRIAKNQRRRSKKLGSRSSWIATMALAAAASATLPGARPGLSATHEISALDVEASSGGREAGSEAGRIRFEIPPGPLVGALADFAALSGWRVEFDARTLGSLATRGVRGLLGPERALQRLLEGTGLEIHATAKASVEIGFPSVADTIEVSAPPGLVSPKYTESLRETPQTITIVPRQLFAEQGATTLRDVLRNVTGISIQAGEGGGGLPGDNLAIRGFAARNDIFVDGVRDFGAYSRDPYNLDQVEVAKGPASAIAGRGSTGGVINLTTKMPMSQASRSAVLSAGSDRFERATLDVNQPFDGAIPNSALRLNAVWSQGDTPGRDEVETSRWGVAPSLALGLGQPTRVRLSYSYLEQDNLPEYGIPWVPATNRALAEYEDRPAPVSFDNFYGLVDRDHEDLKTGIANAVVEHDFGTFATLRSTVRYGDANRDSVITAPRFASEDSTDLNRQLQSRLLDDTILAHQTDLNFQFATGTVEHSMVTGVELAKETSRNRLRTGPTAPLADLFDPDPHQPYEGPVVLSGARTESDAKTTAAYLFDTVSLGASWKVTAGARWDRFAIDFENVAVDGTTAEFGRTDEYVSWKASVVRGLGNSGSAYFGVGTSFNPSADGNTGLSLTAATVDLEPETSRTFELGTKWDLLGARLSLNAALFRSEKTNARTPGVLADDPPTVLEGEQRVDGVELGLTGRITSNWSVFAGYSHMESEVLRSNTPAEVGQRLANTPEDSFSFWSSYRFGAGLELGGGANYVGDRFSNNTNNRRAPAYWLIDATAAYEVNDRLTLRLNGSNLADERYIDRVGGGHFIPGPSRSLALTTAIKF